MKKHSLDNKIDARLEIIEVQIDEYLGKVYIQSFEDISERV